MAGGAAGASVRYGLLQLWPATEGFPWPVLILNIAGSFLLGALMVREWRRPLKRLALHAGLGTGFCGGLTTFSTFAVEMATFIDNSRYGLALTYGFASMVSSIVAAAFGAWSSKRFTSEAAETTS